MNTAKMGRPTDNQKDTMLRIRADKDTSSFGKRAIAVL